VLFVELPLDRVDVNVHPQKLEVRFADAREVHDALFHAVAGVLRTAPWLGRRGGVSPAEAVVVPVAGEDVAGVLAWARARHPDPGAAPGQPDSPGAPGEGPAPPVAAEDGAPRPAGYFGSLRFVGQHALTYLVCEAPGGSLVVVDQHASHERLLFQRLREAWAARQLAVQPLLVPRMVEVPPATARALEGAADRLARVGLEIEPFGGDSFAVKGTPAVLGGVDLERLLVDLAAQLEHLDRGSALDDAFHDLLATMACHSAVRAGQPLGPEEAQALLDALDGVDFKARCPHGRPVVFELTLADLERRVGRR
jgi:DNA mismatch repair protein MutL